MWTLSAKANLWNTYYHRNEEMLVYKDGWRSGEVKFLLYVTTVPTNMKML
jgi:hypothetical protein